MATIQKPTPWIVCLAILAIFFVPYGILNHIPFERQNLPFILNEEKIPFLSWSFVIYISLFFQGMLVIRKIPKRFLLPWVKIAGFMVLLHVIAFILFPISYPRERTPDENFLAFIIRETDMPVNCFPSLHVSATLLFAVCFSLIEMSKGKIFLMWVWSTAVILSVLTTKQHYAIDILGSFWLTTGILLVFRKKINIASPAPS